MDTTQTASSFDSSLSRGIGRMYARTTVGSGADVIHTALKKARAKFGPVDAMAFVDGWHDERHAMRG